VVNAEERETESLQAIVDAGDSGERGRNRTYNLLIKSQLLCQLSYAPTASGKVGTNFDYTIRFCAVPYAVEPELCYFSGHFCRRNLDFGARLR
jgi:hypothetical protein